MGAVERLLTVLIILPELLTMVMVCSMLDEPGGDRQRIEVLTLAGAVDERRREAAYV